MCGNLVHASLSALAAKRRELELTATLILVF